MNRNFLKGLIFGIFIMTPCFVQAQDSITVIQEDGTKVVVPLDEPEAILPGSDAPAPEPVPPAPVETPAPVPTEKPVQEIESKPYVDEIIAPSEEPGVQPSYQGKQVPIPEPKKEEPAPPKSKEKKSKKKVVKTEKQVEGTYEHVIPEGAVVDEKLAASIALDIAPPSTGYTVQRQSYKGTDVFTVTFETEEGPYDVLVETATGKVLISGYVETSQAKPTAPGHLPSTWEPFTPRPVGSPEKK